MIRLLANGSLVIIPPTPEEIHPAGLPYEWMQGDLFQVPTISDNELEDMLALARRFDRRKKDPVRIVFEAPQHQLVAAERVGDQYNATADIHQLLEKYGWRYAGKNGDNTYYTRPGKPGGISASWHEKLRVFYVFTSNAPPLEPNKGYTPFALYATLECHGDFKEAARRLADEMGLSSHRKNGSPSLDAILLEDDAVGDNEEEPLAVQMPEFLIPAAQVTPRPLEWIIPGLASRGDHTILAGDPGEGKTMFVLELVHGLTTGEAVQDRQLPHPIRVGWLGLDMDFGDIVERYIAIYGCPPPLTLRTYPFEMLDKYGLLPITKENLPAWIRIIKAAKLDLLVVDALLDFIQPMDNDKAHEARKYMDLIKRLALRANVAVLSIMHARKGARKRTVQSLLGSILYGGKAECVAFLLRDMELGVTKLNVVKLRRRGEFEGNYELAYQWRNDRFVPVEIAVPEAKPLAEDILLHLITEGPQSRKALQEMFSFRACQRTIDTALATLVAQRRVRVTSGGWNNREKFYEALDLALPTEDPKPQPTWVPTGVKRIPASAEEMRKMSNPPPPPREIRELTLPDFVPESPEGVDRESIGGNV